MTDAATREATFERVCELMGQAKAKQPAPAPAVPWHEHGAFEELDAAHWQLERARSALAGIAALMQPDSQAGNEQLNTARRADAFAVFDFFAEAMREPLEVVDSAANRLKTALRTGQP